MQGLRLQPRAPAPATWSSAPAVSASPLLRALRDPADSARFPATIPAQWGLPPHGWGRWRDGAGQVRGSRAGERTRNPGPLLTTRAGPPTTLWAGPVPRPAAPWKPSARAPESARSCGPRSPCRGIWPPCCARGVSWPGRCWSDWTEGPTSSGWLDAGCPPSLPASSRSAPSWRWRSLAARTDSSCECCRANKRDAVRRARIRPCCRCCGAWPASILPWPTCWRNWRASCATAWARVPDETQARWIRS